MNEDKGTILNAAVLKLNASAESLAATMNEDIQPRALVVEEVTLLELDEKTNFNNDDLFLVSDQEGNTNKIQLSNLIGGGVAQGNKKAVSGETVKTTLDNYPTDSQVDNKINGALANYNKQIILTSGYNDTIENIVASLRQNGIIQVGQNTVKGGDTYANRIVITNCGGITNTDATLNTTLEINYSSSNIYSVRILIGRSYGTTIKSGNIFYFYKESSTLTYWEKVVTENETPIIKGLYTDANSCYEVPKTDGLKVCYYSANTNSPDSNYGWMIETKVQKSNTTYFGTQLATRNGGVPLMYIRTISFNTSGVATSFGKWRKITLDES